MEWLIWDLLALAILSLLVWDCARKGFLRKVINFLGALAAAVAAAFLSSPLALWIYDNLVRDAVRAVLSSQIAAALEGGGGSGGLLAALPGWAVRMAPETSLPMPQEEDQILAAVEQLLDAALAQPILTLLRGLCFFVLFALLVALARYIARMFQGVNRIPLVGSVNAVLGGALGVGEALIALYLLAVMARLLVTYTGGGAFFNDQSLGGGYLFSFFYRLT